MTLTDNEGNTYELVEYTTEEQDSEGYYYTERHGLFMLKPVEGGES